MNRKRLTKREREKREINGLDRQMKEWQNQPREGRIPQGPLTVTQYQQPQRLGYRLAAGFSRLRNEEL